MILSIGNGGDSRIYRTDDGGRTWKQGFRNASDDAFYDCLSFWDRRHGLAMSDPVHGKFRILVTKNGGRSWRSGPAPGCRRRSTASSASRPAAPAGRRTAGKSDAWFAGGGAAARVFHSVDRGKKWSVTDTPVVRSDAGGIFSLAARDLRRSSQWAVIREAAQVGGHVGVLRDGGTTWHAGGDLDGYRSGSAFCLGPRPPARRPTA